MLPHEPLAEKPPVSLMRQAAFPARLHPHSKGRLTGF